MATGMASVSAPRPAKAARRVSAASVDLEEVARAAYALYEQRGCENGHDVEDWLTAERIVGGRRNNGQP